MARLRDVVFDCRHPASLARFWASVLDGYEVAPYDEAELQRLREQGIDDPEDDPTVLVWAGPGVAPRLFFQQVPERRITKNRVHLDVLADHTESEVERLVTLGAQVLTRYSSWTTLTDPEGNEFCVSSGRE